MLPATSENAGTEADRVQLEQIVESFFAAFTSGPDSEQRLQTLRSLFVPQARIARTCGLPVEMYDIDGFIAPRAALLAGGTLTDFREWPVDGRIDVFGDIAQWFGSYAKSWVADGATVTGQGMKSIQFVRTDEGWRISAAAWDDAR